MDTLNPPTKPPRGVKNAKETSGLLMTVIRTLSTSDSNEQRDQERTKLERDYKKSNQQLEELVSVNHDELTRVMNLFGRLSTLISHSKEKVHASKENLIACKTLLTCRREELKKLRLERVEYRKLLQLLNDIETIKDVPSQLVSCFSQKDYVKATRLLTSAFNICDQELKEVVGLQELKSDLQLKKQELYLKLLKEMQEQIYEYSTHEIIILKRQGSSRNDSLDHNSTAIMHHSDRKISPKPNRYRSTNFLDVSNNMKNKVQKNEYVQYSDDPEYVISNLVECVVLLDKSKECLEELKQNTQRQLNSLIKRTTKEMWNDSSNILLEFLQVIMEQFKRVIDCHMQVLESFKKNNFTTPIYDVQDVWLKMQAVLQVLLAQYLEDVETKKVETRAVENGSSMLTEQYDINSYFTRKKSQRTIRGSLFKFKNSAQNEGISKTFEKEAGKEKQLLCKPSPQHISQVFVPLTNFADEMERLISNSEKPCKLNVFLNELISKKFPNKHHQDIIKKAIDNNNEAFTSKEPNEVIPNSNSLLSVSKKKPKIKRAFSYFLLVMDVISH